MKKRRCSICICALFFLTVGICWAQQQVTSVSTLKEQIQKLEAIDRDPATPEEVKVLNSRFLNERRLQLKILLQQRIETLRKYQETVKTTLTNEENRIIVDAIVELENDLQTLEKVIKDVPGIGLPSRQQTTTSSGVSAESANVSMKSVLPADSSTRLKESTSGPPLQQSVAAVSPATCNGATDSYQDAPPLLRDAVEGVADDIISGAQAPADALSFRFPDMFFYALAHAVAPAADTSVSSIKSLKAYQYLGETVRTDKQVGAGAKSGGTTSAIEKPGFTRLLGFAVENGAILQDVSQTGLTLSTSPYLLFTFNRGGDTAENYQRAGLLNRIGLSATFNLSNQNDVLSNATRRQLTEWSVKGRVFGDRSTRSKAFQEFWRQPGGPQEAIQKRLQALTNSFRATLPGFGGPDFDPFINVEDDIGAVVTALLASPSYKGASDVEKKRLLVNAILCTLKSEVYTPITSNSIAISQPKKDAINHQLVPSLAAALGNIDSVRKLVEDKLEEFQKGPLATLAYVNHRQPAGSDYSEGKFLYSHESSALSPVKLVANLGFSFYHKPNRQLNQQTARDISAALSFEGSADSPFLKGTADLSKITYAFTGAYQRTFENRHLPGRKADIGAFQFKLDVPVFAGASFPISVTYANATEQQRRSGVRTNFGFNFDTDKLMSILQLLK